MPGPGGGGHSGGFGGGGFSGGGPRPGMGPGMGPGMRPGMGPFFFRRRPRGGCMWPFFGFSLIPVGIFIVLLFSFGTCRQPVYGSSSVNYSESRMQDYADKQYRKAFGPEGLTTYEDNILLVMLVDKDYDSWYSIAWVGDNIVESVNMLWGDENTAFGGAMLSYVGSYFKYSLDTDLANVVDCMDSLVLSTSGGTVFRTKTYGVHESAGVVNNSKLEMDTTRLEQSVSKFTADTGIPLVVVIDSAEKVM